LEDNKSNSPLLALRSGKAVSSSEQIMSAGKYPSIFSRQMEAIVYLDLFIENSKYDDNQIGETKKKKIT